jgi:hypothetical protein
MLGRVANRVDGADGLPEDRNILRRKEVVQICELRRGTGVIKDAVYTLWQTGTIGL